MANPISQIPIERRIWLIRGQRVMLDFDLADFYGVTTKRLNEQVKRNSARFPKDFMFRLSRRELSEVVAICDHLQKLRFTPVPPAAFTEHGAVMLASVIKNPIAIRTSVAIVRAFNRLREAANSNERLSKAVAEHSHRLAVHDEEIGRILDALQEKKGKERPTRRIGFQPLSEPAR